VSARKVPSAAKAEKESVDKERIAKEKPPKENRRLFILYMKKMAGY